MQISIIRSCLFCGSAWAQSTVCKRCWIKWGQSPQKVKNRFLNNEIAHFYLWDWNFSREKLPQLIHYLKTPESADLLKQILNLYREPLRAYSDFEAVVFAASKTKNWEHSRQIAVWWSTQLKIPMIELGLEKLEHNYKKMNREERYRHRKIAKKTAIDNMFKQILFVDDVLTSGATAMAVEKIMPRGCKMGVFTLAYRHPTGKGGFVGRASHKENSSTERYY